MGNPHRKRGTGKGTLSAWQNRTSMESEPVMPEVSARKNKKEKKADIIDLNSKRPVAADNVHSGPSIPSDEESDKELEKKLLEATADILNQEREEARVKIEKRKEVEFSDAEKRFIGPMIDDYSQYFFKRKEQAEKKRVKINENWIEAIRQFYIDERKRWGMKRQIAAEKAELLGKYLELNLPAGIPEEKKKNSDPNMNSEEKKEKGFTPEQSSELLQLIGVVSQRFKEWIKDSEQWGPEFGDEETRKKAIFEQIIKEMMGSVIMNDPVMKDIFSEEEIPRAVEHSLKFIEKFNFNIIK